MLTITYKEYAITVKKDNCTLRQSFKNKNMVLKQRTIGHFPNVPKAVERIAEHELHSKDRTIELKQYLKDYRQTVDRFWELIK